MMDWLDEIAQRAAEATPGPWELRRFDECQTVVLGPEKEAHRHPLICTVSTGGGRPDGDANGEFIAHAREDIPKLVATLRAVERLAERMYYASPAHPQTWWATELHGILALASPEVP